MKTVGFPAASPRRVGCAIDGVRNPILDCEQVRCGAVSDLVGYVGRKSGTVWVFAITANENCFVTDAIRTQLSVFFPDWDL